MEDRDVNRDECPYGERSASYALVSATQVAEEIHEKIEEIFQMFALRFPNLR